MFARRSTFVESASARVASASVRVASASACVLASACASTTPASRPPTAEPAGAPAPSRVPDPDPGAAFEPAPRPAPELHVDTSGKAPHYIFELALRREELVLTGPLLQREMAYAFVDGGQFEIYVTPATIPANAPDCDAIIVRMPWTNPELPEAAADVERKRALFSRVDDLVHERSTEATAVVQLDPHVEPAKEGPHELSLTRCEAFFRHDPETYAYVDHLGPRRAQPR